MLRRGDPYVLMGFLTLLFGEYCLKPDGLLTLLGDDKVGNFPNLVDEEFRDRRFIELLPIFDLDEAIGL